MDNNEKDLVVTFTEKAELVFSDILKNYGLEETDIEFNEYISEDKESKEMLVRDAVTIIAQKKVPEEKLIELLQKHLEIPKDIVERLLKDIKKQLLPLLLIYPEEKLNDPVFIEEISRKISGEKKDNTLPYLKKVEVTNVEENAKKLEGGGKTIKRESNQDIENKEENQQTQDKKPDSYRELIE